jgi:hypothetical protein
MAKGRSQRTSNELEEFFNRSPGEVFTALEGFVSNMPPLGNDKDLGYGYLFLLEGLLLRLRYRIDRGYPDARDLVEEFQAAMAARVRDGSMSASLLGLLAGVLQQAGIAASPVLIDASTALADRSTGHVAESDLDEVLKELIKACGGDPFVLVASGEEASHAMPQEARVALVIGLALARDPVARSAAVLFLLDPSPEIRIAAAGALAQVCAALSPTDVRRLIAIRDWRPEQERAAIDALVSRTREAGIDEAPWPAGSVEEVRASGIDGASSQSLLIVSPMGRKSRLSSILVKNGVADAFVGRESSRRQTDSTLARAFLEVQMLPVSRGYLDGVVCHHLALLAAVGRTPPVGLLAVAETIGGARWRPVQSTFEAILGELLAVLPKPVLAAASVRAILARSGELAELDWLADSWFEDDAEARRLHAAGRGARTTQKVDYVLQTVIARRRDKWADLLLRTAAWLREAGEGDKYCWREIAVVAKAVAEGRDLAEIGLMRRIASRTVDFLEDDRHVSPRADL